MSSDSAQLKRRKQLAEFLFKTAEHLLESGIPVEPTGAVVAVSSQAGYRIFTTKNIGKDAWSGLLTAVRDEEMRQLFGFDPSEQRRKFAEDARKQQAEFELTHSFVCDSGPCHRRFKTSSGLDMHKSRSYFHREMRPTPDGRSWINKQIVKER